MGWWGCGVVRLWGCRFCCCLFVWHSIEILSHHSLCSLGWSGTSDLSLWSCISMLTTGTWLYSWFCKMLQIEDVMFFFVYLLVICVFGGGGKCRRPLSTKLVSFTFCFFLVRVLLEKMFFDGLAYILWTLKHGLYPKCTLKTIILLWTCQGRRSLCTLDFNILLYCRLLYYSAGKNVLLLKKSA